MDGWAEDHKTHLSTAKQEIIFNIMNRTLRRTLAGIAGTVALFSVNLTSQDSKPPATSPSSVTVPFFPLDSQGKAASGIAQSTLLVLDDKRPSPSVLALHTAKELPLRLGVLIDISKSESASRLFRPVLRTTLDFVNQILQTPEDRVFFVTFSNTSTTTELMGKESLQNFDLHLTSGGGTALYDAIATACKNRLQADQPQLARRVLLILSDGEDNASQLNSDRAIAAAQESSSVIFAVSTTDEPLETRGNQRLKEFAEQTGGQAFLHIRRENIATVFLSIHDEIGEMHSITFVPVESDDPRHSFEVKATSDKAVRLRAPKRYYSPPGR